MIRSLALIALSATLGACSTIDRGIYDNVRVDTVPQGATASFVYIPANPIRGQPGAVKRMVCEATPCAFEVPRTRMGIVKVEKDGFAPSEYFVAPSRFRGGAGVDLGTTTVVSTATSLGTGVTAGLVSASVAQFSYSIAYAIPNAISTALGGSGSLAPTVNTSSFATAGTGIGIGIAAGSILIDMGTAANSNVYPNPVVIGMAEMGTEVEEDPFVIAYYKLMASYRQRETICKSRKKRNTEGFNCVDARREFYAIEKKIEALEKERDDSIKALIDAQKEAQE